MIIHTSSFLVRITSGLVQQIVRMLLCFLCQCVSVCQSTRVQRQAKCSQDPEFFTGERQKGMEIYSAAYLTGKELLPETFLDNKQKRAYDLILTEKDMSPRIHYLLIPDCRGYGNETTLTSRQMKMIYKEYKSM